jgi:hypothetical protein
MLPFSSDTVTLIGIAVALLQTLLLAVAGFVAWFQLRESSKARYLEALVRMFDDFGSREAYHHTDMVLGLPKHVADYTHDERELAIWVVRVYEKIGFLVESGMMPADYIVPLYSRRIVWTWDALWPFIKEQRDLRNSGGAYRLAGDGKYFEQLYKRALAYRKSRYPGRIADPPIPEAYREQVLAEVRAGGRLLPDPNWR